MLYDIIEISKQDFGLAVSLRFNGHIEEVKLI